MQYKTIVLELLRQNTKLHEQLRRSDTLLETMNEQTLQLRARHHEWMAVLAEATPGSEPSQFSGVAFELALKEWEDCLANDSLPDQPNPLNLDDAMAYLRRHSSNG